MAVKILDLFVGYSSEAADVAHDLIVKIGDLRPQIIVPRSWEFSENYKPNRSTLENLLSSVSSCDAALFLLTADDTAKIRSVEHGVARDNVLLELGIATGALGLDRVVVIKDERLTHVPSDWLGLQLFRLGRASTGFNTESTAVQVHTYLRNLSPHSRLEARSIGLRSIAPNAASGIDYLQSLEMCRSKLRFLGTSGSRLTEHRDALRSALRRIDSENGEARFLLWDPRDTLSTDRDADPLDVISRIHGALRTLRELEIEGLPVRVRFYRAPRPLTFPPFRVMMLNETELLVSFALFGQAQYEEDSAQLYLDVGDLRHEPASWSMYRSFERYFAQSWQSNASSPNLETMIATLESRYRLREPDHEVGCVHGRFQPPHREHLDYMLGAKARCRHLIIGITQPDITHLSNSPLKPHRATPASNPLTYEERCEAIGLMLVDAGVAADSFSFMRFPIDSPDDLSTVLSSEVRCYTTICEPWNRHKMSVLTDLGYDVAVLWDHSQARNVTGTAIRQKMYYSDVSWHDDVPPPVVHFLERIELPGRIRRLSAMNGSTDDLIE